MAKEKAVFFCKECGYESSKWTGQCPACKQWNTFTEEPVVRRKSNRQSDLKVINEPVNIADIRAEEEKRLCSGIEELDRVLGGGIVKGSLVLVGGDPGIGKSTLLLQMCSELANKEKKILYVSGEESLSQISMRARRLGVRGTNLYILCETNLEYIEEAIHKHNPDIVIIDSIQTMFSNEVEAAPGSVSQVREATGILMKIAKGDGVTVFIIGHVTKEGVVAGPRVLEHMVDTVLYFEGDNTASYRILRAVKNRFGSTNEIGVFQMQGGGLMQVKNPSEFMLKGRPEGKPGSVVTASIEGTRPILVEVQALVCRTNFSMPKRTAAGTDYNRVNLLMAVLEKRAGLQLSDCDAYVNVAGGIKIVEPALDLAVIAAALSSYKNIAFDNKTVIFGEVGLTGEIRAVNMAEQRVTEAAKLGFETCILPMANKENINAAGIGLVGVNNIQEIAALLRK